METGKEEWDRKLLEGRTVGDGERREDGRRRR